MLRLSVFSSASATTLKLYGMLDGSRVDELEHCWQILRMTRGGRPIRVELADRKHIGCRGEELLAAMRREGVIIVECDRRICSQTKRRLGQ